MFINYFKTAWRSLLRNKAYGALNILGLATGMAVALLIGLWVYYQYSYDKFLPGYKQLYQVRRNFYGNGDTLTYGGTSLKLVNALRSQIPEIQYVAETDGFGMHGLMVADKNFLKSFAITYQTILMHRSNVLQGSFEPAASVIAIHFANNK